MRIPEPNPGRAGACSECGAWRLDGRPPYLHKPGCSQEGDLQMDRFLAERAAGDLGGPTLYATEADAALARKLGVKQAAVAQASPQQAQYPAAQEGVS